jgi:signal transduction histidine kinase
MNWRDRIGLRARIYLLLAGLVGVTLAGGAVMIWYTYMMGELFTGVINRDVAALERARELENELLMQKGYVSYFFITGEDQWLTQLEDHRRKFMDQLQKAKVQAVSEGEKELLEKTETQYQQYVRSKDQVIALYQAGEKERGAALHQEVRADFFKVLSRCREYIKTYKERIQSSLVHSQVEARRYRIVAAAAMTVALALGMLLAFVLVAQILEPIRKLARETASDRGSRRGGDEISDLKTRVRGLMQDADHTRSELERSRERLFQSEKMAVIGKLAADVAHSIRNPMTSIKMRLFSLERSLELSPNQKEDLEVVSEEMRRLDNIVRNFLEFSRPPKLKKQKVVVADVLEMTLQLLQHRLELHGVEVEKRLDPFVPAIDADPELLKEFLVNFIVNACEAMKDGGKLTITEEEAMDERIGRSVRIAIADTGPGIPEALQSKVFEPFFSTKEDGTGLGLSIALRIIDEHGGRLDLRSSEGEGATFIIPLPISEVSK